MSYEVGKLASTDLPRKPTKWVGRYSVDLDITQGDILKVTSDMVEGQRIYYKSTEKKYPSMPTYFLAWESKLLITLWSDISYFATFLKFIN